MKICAIVLNYRDATCTADCLRSLAGQGLAAALVVDNSADVAAATDLAAVMRLVEPELDYALRQLDPGVNLGFARGVNLALREALASGCDAFLLVNDDAVALPGMVEKLAGAEAAVVAPTVLNATTGAPQPPLWYQRFFGLLTASPLPGSFLYPSGCCLLVRREALTDGKLFDEDFFMYGEDTLLGWRLTCAGRKFLRLDDAFVRHEGAGQAGECSLFYEYHMARAHLLLAMKTWRYPLEVPLLLACKCTGLGLRALWRGMRFGSLVPLRAGLMAWRKADIRAD